MAMTPQFAIIIPVLNEAANIGACLQALQPLRPGCEIILADGGSSDLTIAIAAPLADKIVHAPSGRARQMNAAASEAQAAVLLFLHADSLLPENALQLIQQGIAAGRLWGRFDAQLDGRHPMLKVVAFMMNWRSRLTGIATGDQGIFMTRQAFDSVGGFPDIALMEDIAMSIMLKRLGKPCCLRAKIVTSARRWERYGIVKTILLMWRLRLSYFFGADPQRLAQQYYRS
jgi:rSAM/selenodomain-associated transferase 2